MRKSIALLLLLSPMSYAVTHPSGDARSFADRPVEKKQPPFPHLHWQSADNKNNLDIGGALRANYRYEDWSSSNYRNPPHLRFDTFRIDASGNYQQTFFDAGFWFQDQRKYAIDRAYIGYHLSQHSDIQLGAPFKPFGLMPYPQFGWSYGIPFYLGFGVNAGLGAKYQYHNGDWTFDAAYFPRMMPAGVRYAPEVGSYDDLKSAQRLQLNEKRDQVNLRLTRAFRPGGWHNELGASLAASRLYNQATGDSGSFWAAGLHTLLNNDPWHVSGQIIRYSYSAKGPAGADNSTILMGGNGLTPSYLIPAQATTASLNLARDVALEWGPVQKLRFYNDYSVLWKDDNGGSDSKMNTLGVQVFALPVMLWIDLTWAQNANPWGGAENATGWTSTHSSGSNKWYFRTNVNIGYYF
ncbi:hypothetical protein [Serratia rubidaea]|uniref:hypothetical protein n=1 Tax=Serratia rubidaea TaxID=61652 RepID=UPI0022B8DB26|nr:hypothetical protein [Serratia rubidaea]WBF47501.1 hypothetical protein OLD77_10805 [Serratia rubidaea]